MSGQHSAHVSLYLKRKRNHARHSTRRPRLTEEQRAIPRHIRERDQRIAYKRKAREADGARPRAAICEAHVNAWRIEQDRIAERQKHLYDQHVKVWAKEKPAAAFVNKYRTDPEFNAKQKLRARLRKMATLDGKLSAYMSNSLKKGSMWKAWTALLGYDARDLTAHLQRTIPKGATWADFLSGALHIDHIIPRAAFDLTLEADVRECWSLSNLRLLWAHENQRKAARMETLC